MALQPSVEVKIGGLTYNISTPQEAQEVINRHDGEMSGSKQKALEDFADSDGSQSELEELGRRIK